MRPLSLLAVALPAVLAAHKDAGIHRRSSAGVKRASSYSLTHDFSGDKFLDAFNFVRQLPRLNAARCLR
jgi:hypothetical protein